MAVLGYAPIASPVSHGSSGSMQRRASTTHPSPNIRPNPSPMQRSDMIGQMGEANPFGVEGVSQSGHMTQNYSPMLGGQGYAGIVISSAPSENYVLAPGSDNVPGAGRISTEPSPSSFATSPSQWGGVPFAGSQRITHHGSVTTPVPGDQHDITGSGHQLSSSYHPPFSQADPYQPFNVAPANPSHFPQYSTNIAQATGLGPRSRRRPRITGMQQSSQISYPSPHSEASDTPGTFAHASMPEKASPHALSDASPSLARSSISQPEPPRNAQGQIYCSHSECAQDPPTFNRKCEWT